MDAIKEIEAALAAGPTETEWRPLVTRIDDARGYQICHFDLHGKSEKERDANRALVVACQPTAIREVLQTLASKGAEIERMRAALNGMLTHMGMDEDEWNKPTFDQARAALRGGE